MLNAVLELFRGSLTVVSAPTRRDASARGLRCRSVLAVKLGSDGIEQLLDSLQCSLVNPARRRSEVDLFKVAAAIGCKLVRHSLRFGLRQQIEQARERRILGSTALRRLRGIVRVVGAIVLRFRLRRGMLVEKLNNLTHAKLTLCVRMRR
jgi:hypothetical protein